MGRRIDILYDEISYMIKTVELNDEYSKLSNEEILELIRGGIIEFEERNGDLKMWDGSVRARITVGHNVGDYEGDIERKYSGVEDEEAG